MEEEIANDILKRLNAQHSSTLINFFDKLIEKDSLKELELKNKIEKYNNELKNLDTTIQNTNVQQKESSKKSSNKMDLESFQTSDDGKINLNSFHSPQDQSEIMKQEIDEDFLDYCYDELIKKNINIDSFIKNIIELYKLKVKK